MTSGVLDDHHRLILEPRWPTLSSYVPHEWRQTSTCQSAQDARVYKIRCPLPWDLNGFREFSPVNRNTPCLKITFAQNLNPVSVHIFQYNSDNDRSSLPEGIMWQNP